MTAALLSERTVRHAPAVSSSPQAMPSTQRRQAVVRSLTGLSRPAPWQKLSKPSARQAALGAAAGAPAAGPSRRLRGPDEGGHGALAPHFRLLELGGGNRPLERRAQLLG